MKDEDFIISAVPEVRPGGQHVTMIRTDVKVTHVPTQVSIIVGTERSQLKNKDKAIEMLKFMLPYFYEIEV